MGSHAIVQKAITAVHLTYSNPPKRPYTSAKNKLTLLPEVNRYTPWI